MGVWVSEVLGTVLAVTVGEVVFVLMVVLVLIGVYVRLGVSDMVGVSVLVKVGGTVVGLGGVVAVAGMAVLVYTVSLGVAVNFTLVALGLVVTTTVVSVGMIIMSCSLVALGTLVWVAEAVAVTVVVAVGVAVSAELAVENVVLMRIKNVMTSPIPMGNMKLSGIVWARASGRLGRLLRASGTLRRRGWVDVLSVGAGWKVGLVVAPSSDSIARVALGDELRGCASPATNADDTVLLGNWAKAASIAILKANPLW
jgi:hypothetical protein